MNKREQEKRLIELRRSKCLELAAKGFNNTEIAEMVKSSEPTVSRDLAHLKRQARENIRNYIDEELPNDRRTYDWRTKFDLLEQMGGCCFDCGVRELAALEIHHSEPFHHSLYQKEWESIRVKLRRNKKLRGEILSGYKHGKYFLLCCNCNRRDAQKQIGSEPFIQEALARLDRTAITNGERNITVDNHNLLQIIVVNIIFLLCIFIFLKKVE